MFGVNAVAMALSVGLPALALSLLCGATAAFFYLPVVGRSVAAILVAASAGVFAFDAGWRERASLDASGALRAQIAQLKASADEANLQASFAAAVARDATAAQALAEDETAQIKTEAENYEKQLSKSPAQPVCGLSPGDVAGLRRIGSR